MPRLNLEQGSKEWHDYRSCHIMATSASIIMGTHQYKNELQLWKEMHGIILPSKPTKKMEEGSKLEPEARKLANEILGIEFEPCVYQSDIYPWMAASLDGISPCGEYILEIKCGEKTHNLALEKIIPLDYQDQMTHQANCNKKTKKVFYFTYRPEFDIKYTIADFIPDPDRKEKMIFLEEKFWEKYCTLEIPVWQLKK